MKVDPTTLIVGTGVKLDDPDYEGIIAELTSFPVLDVVASANTVSVSKIFVGIPAVGEPPDVDPDPEIDLSLFFGVPSEQLGFGGSAPYVTCYGMRGYT